ncbi:UNVERIFIED_CONTAM: hypothetical protein OHV15_19820, partial [Microbacterium sp. SLM126]
MDETFPAVIQRSNGVATKRVARQGAAKARTETTDVSGQARPPRQAIQREMGAQVPPPQDSAPAAATPAEAKRPARRKAALPLEHCAPDAPPHEGPAHEAYGIRALVLQG